jgi:hypothetical protein
MNEQYSIPTKVFIYWVTETVGGGICGVYADDESV